MAGLINQHRQHDLQTARAQRGLADFDEYFVMPSLSPTYRRPQRTKPVGAGDSCPCPDRQPSLNMTAPGQKPAKVSPAQSRPVVGNIATQRHHRGLRVKRKPVMRSSWTASLPANRQGPQRIRSNLFGIPASTESHSPSRNTS